MRKFKEVYTPDKHLSLDEGILAYKGKLSFKVYNKDKPNKYGIKLYILAESITGYVVNFDVYIGNSKTTIEIVNNLVSDFHNLGYHLYMDNFYNSVKLSEDLLKKKIFTCGTLRLNRGSPKTLQEKVKYMKSDEIQFQRKGDVFVIVWYDKKPVKMITTLHNADVLPVEKNRKIKKKFQKVTVNKPKAVIDYNKFMSGVDHFDQMIKYYKFTRKTRKWTKKLTFYLFQMAIHNAFVLYKQYTLDRKPVDLMNFHIKIYEYLLNFDINEWPSTEEPDELIFQQNLHADNELLPLRNISNANKIAVRIQDSNKRLVEKNHQLVTIENKKRRRCRICYTMRRTDKRTGTQCNKCLVSLCAVDCFYIYHNKIDIHYRGAGKSGTE